MAWLQKSEYEISVSLLGRTRHQIFDVGAVLFVEQGQRGSGGRTRSARAYDGPLTLTDTCRFLHEQCCVWAVPARYPIMRYRRAAEDYSIDE